VRQVEEGVDQARLELDRAKRAHEIAQRAADAAERRYQSEASITSLASWRIIGMGLVLGLATFLLAAFADFKGPDLVDFAASGLPPKGWAWAALLSLLVAIAGAFIFLRTAGLPILALFSFLAIPLVFAVATYYRASEAPQVEPVALLRADGTPFVGFSLAETEERVFVGTFREETPGKSVGSVESVPARLLSLPAGEVSNLTVGPLQALNAEDADHKQDSSQPRTAREWAAGAALLLCESAERGRARAIARQQADRASTDEPLPLTCGRAAVNDLEEFGRAESRAIAEASEETD